MLKVKGLYLVGVKKWIRVVLDVPCPERWRGW